MKILEIETSTDACSAAITEQGEVLVCGGERLHRIERTGSEHARALPVMVKELLDRCGSIDAVAVSAGPGSYTGLRIGASTAKGLAYGLNVPLLAVSTLQSMAAQAAAQIKDALLCPMIDARRMEVYCALYSADLREQSPVAAVVVDENSFREQLEKGKICFFGNGAAKCKDVLRSPNAIFLDDIVPDAAWMGRVPAEPVDVAYWTPFYLKEYEAKRSSGFMVQGSRIKV